MYPALKRCIDVVGAGLGVIVLSPLILIVSFLIWLEDQGPVFYNQERIGIDGKVFQLIKFRSMKVNKISPTEMGQVRSDNPMVTRVGKVIRRLKLDELPQLLNVLKGDMSLVGPRPTLPEQVQTYSDYEWLRLRVPPGMTGWAQVNGNINLSWGERILLDRWYVNNRSLLVDLVILLKTTRVIFMGEIPNSNALKEAAACEDSFDRNCD